MQFCGALVVFPFVLKSPLAVFICFGLANWLFVHLVTFRLSEILIRVSVVLIVFCGEHLFRLEYVTVDKRYNSSGDWSIVSLERKFGRKE